MTGGWEYAGRLVLGAEPGRCFQRTPPRRCRGPVARFAARVPALDPEGSLTLRVSTRARNDTNWVVRGTFGGMSVPSESSLLVEGLQDEYRFEFELVGLPALGDPNYVDLYENWRRHDMG